MNAKSVLFASLAMLAVACSSSPEEPVLPNPPVVNPPVDESTKIPIQIMTRAESVGQTFVEGSKVGVYVVNYNGSAAGTLVNSGNYVNNVCFTLTGNVWTPASEIYWKDNQTHADFYLYYPYTASLTPTAYPVSVNANQGTASAFNACDLLAGVTKNVAPSAGAVSITANHVMSLLQITVKPGDGFTQEELASATIQVKVNGVKTTGTLNLATAAVTPTGTATNVSTYAQGDSYQAYLIPQQVEAGKLITVNVDGTDYSLKRSEPITFATGKQYTFTVNVTKTSSGINVSIGQWGNDGLDYGGVAD